MLDSHMSMSRKTSWKNSPEKMQWGTPKAPGQDIGVVWGRGTVPGLGKSVDLFGASNSVRKAPRYSGEEVTGRHQSPRAGMGKSN